MDVGVATRPMRADDGAYHFQAGRIYNLEASAYIRNSLSRFSGAHSDIVHPEVGHLIWSAAMA